MARVDRWRCASLLGCLLLVALALGFGADAGLTYDESEQVVYAKQVLAWFSSAGEDTRALSYKYLWAYGALFELPVQWLSNHSALGLYETRHMLTALVGVLGVIVTWKIAARIADARAGFLASALLVLTPVWTGHALFNPKDIPFAVGAALTSYACTRIALAEEILTASDTVRAGVALGIALGVRAGGLFLCGELFLTVCARLLLAHGRRPASALLRRLPGVGLRLLIVGALAWTLMVCTWPWALQSPLARPLEAARIAAHFPYKGRMLFDGQLIKATELPASYLPRWFAITLPETYLLAWSAGALALLLRRRSRHGQVRRGLALGMLALAALGPIVGAIATHAVLYDAYRHLLFVLPPLAALSGVGLSSFFGLAGVWRGARAAVAVVALSAAALTAWDMVQLHPYEYVYFNRSFGGLRAAQGRFETDYWGASYEQGLAWLVRNVHPQGLRRARISTCTASYPLDYYLTRWGVAARFTLERKHLHDADYLLTTTRKRCHETPGDLLHTVERQGVPLLYVIRIAH